MQNLSLKEVIKMTNYLSYQDYQISSVLYLQNVALEPSECRLFVKNNQQFIGYCICKGNAEKNIFTNSKFTVKHSCEESTSYPFILISPNAFRQGFSMCTGRSFVRNNSYITQRFSSTETESAYLRKKHHKFPAGFLYHRYEKLDVDQRHWTEFFFAFQRWLESIFGVTGRRKKKVSGFISNGFIFSGQAGHRKGAGQFIQCVFNIIAFHNTAKTKIKMYCFYRQVFTEKIVFIEVDLPFKSSCRIGF